MNKYLAFDFGAETGRAIVGFMKDSRIVLEEIHRFPNRQVNVEGHFHWDVPYLYEELKRGLSLAVRRGHNDIKSIGIDAWGVDFGLVDKKGKLLELPIAYRDPRTEGIMEQVFKRVPREEIYSSTGIQFMQINTLYQLYSLAVRNPELIETCDKLLFLPDLLTFMLTGEAQSEYTIASTSQMLNVRRKKWDESIFSKVGLPLDIMAQIVFPGTIVGPVRRNIMEELGITREVNVVAVGCHDTASAVAAVPATGNDWAYLSSGTWSLIGIESDDPIIAKGTLGDFTNEGGVGGKIHFLKNLMGMWLLQECRKAWAKAGREYSYDHLAEMAGDRSGCSSIIDPDDPVFLNPSDMSKAILSYCEKTDQRVPANDEEMVVCIIRSLASKYKSVLERIECVTGSKIERLHIVGGGSRNDALNQTTANACGIQVAAGPIEATALGNIMVQAIASGEIESMAAGRELIARSFPVKDYHPSPA